MGALAEARALGFLGPGPLEAHVDQASAFLAALGTTFEGRALDLGSGGGIPGLVLAAWCPASSWTLLDASQRRTAFLSRVVLGLGWTDRVAVLRREAEAAGHEPDLREQFDVVVARSFGPPSATAECAAGLLRVEGRLLVAEPIQADGERWPAAGLAQLGLVLLSRPGDAIAIAAKARALPAQLPRRWAVIQRTPWGA